MYFDIVIAILMFAAAVAGFRDGMLRQIASWVGFVVGLVVACNYASTLGEKTGFGVVVGFLILCIIVPILFSWVASLITKFLDWTIFAGSVNRIGGMALSVCKWTILLSLILYYGAKIVTIPVAIQHSQSYPLLHTFGRYFWELIN